MIDLQYNALYYMLGRGGGRKEYVPKYIYVLLISKIAVIYCRVYQKGSPGENVLITAPSLPRLKAQRHPPNPLLT